MILALPWLNSSLHVNVCLAKQARFISCLKLPQPEKQDDEGSLCLRTLKSSDLHLFTVKLAALSLLSGVAACFYCRWSSEPSRPLTMKLLVCCTLVARRAAVSFVHICVLDKRAELGV